MTGPGRASVLASLAAALVATISCGLQANESARHRTRVIAFSRADAPAAFPGNYLSVLDTAVLSVTTNGATQNYRARIGQRDSLVRFDINVDAGTSTFSAAIISNNGTRLYAGQLTTQLSATADSVVIPLIAVAPVLVLSLDFTTQDAGSQRTFRTSVHNRGTDALSWSVETPTTCGPSCVFTPSAGSVAAGGSVAFAITAPTPAFTTPPGLTLVSPGGKVTIPSASVITPSIALTAGTGAITFVAGASGSVPLTLTRFGGFSGDVALTATGLPAGVTATFAPAVLSAGATSSTLTLAAGIGVAVPATSITVTASGVGVAPQVATFSLAVTPVPAITLQVGATLTATVGTVVTSPITITRIGNYTGDVALTLENAPAGVTAVFSPATITSTGATSSLSLTVSDNATPATSTVTVRATGTGIVAQTAPIALTIVAAPSYRLAAGSLAVVQGTTGTSTVSLTRVGGFAGTVSLAITGLPAGVTATFTPSAVTGTSSSLALAVASAATPGVYVTNIVGTAAGLGNVTTPLTLTVSARPVLTVVGGGTGTGSGRVTSTPAGIDCTITGGVASNVCSAAFDANVTVQLQAATGVIANWSGDCAGAAACAVTMNQNKRVVATLALAPPIITVRSTKPVVVMNRFAQELRTTYAIVNGGSGTLQPTVSYSRADAPWLTDLIVTPSGTRHNLLVAINTIGLRASSEANSPYRTVATISSPGAAPVQIEITFAKAFEQATAVSTTSVRFHVGIVPASTGAPTLFARDTVDLLDARTNARIAASIIAVAPANRTWLFDTISASGQLALRIRNFDSEDRVPSGDLPSGSNLVGAPVRINLRSASGTANCRDVSLLLPPDPSCQVYVYYTSDPYPRLALRPWGVQLTPASPNAIARIETQPGTLSFLTLGAATYLRDDCGNRLTRRPEVTATQITVTGDLAAIPEDTLIRCTVKVQAQYRDANQQLVGTDSANLTVTLAKPSPDVITPTHRDLHFVASIGASSFTETITLYNLGARTITLGAPQWISNSCPAVLGAPVLSGTDGALGLGIEKTLVIPVNPSGQISGTLCTATLRLVSTTANVSPTDIPVTVRRN